MKFKFLNIEISISVLFCLVLSFLLIIDKTGLMTLSLLTVVIHETGHLICMKRLKCCPKSLKFTAYGIFIVSPFVDTDIKEKAVIAFFGPFFNFITAVITYLINLKLNNSTLLNFTIVNIIFAVFNFLPIKGLDGGTVLNGIFAKLRLKNKEKILTVISFIFTFLLIFFGITVFLRNFGNISLLLLGIYLLVINLMKL